MAVKTKLKPIISNNKAVSEEFTTLPALSVVMIGFTIFLLLTANTYNSYENRVESLEKYKTADFIATKITNPDCFFISEGRIINVDLLESIRGKQRLKSLKEEYTSSGFDFIVRLSWSSKQRDFPEKLPTDIKDRIAVSKDIGIYLNQAQTKPGKLTIILWSVFY